jgi:hypothetical protein
MKNFRGLRKAWVVVVVVYTVRSNIPLKFSGSIRIVAAS